ANLPRGRQPLAFPDPAPVTPSPVRSWDPNEKNGPVGVGTQGFVTSLGRVAYQIKFENKKEASAPAYEIVIVDTLASVFDPESVVFGETSWPGFTMERTGNVLRWRAEGIELPPNVNPPEGEGFVNFTVNVRDGLPSGTRVANRATIVFDINPPIVTNTHVNTLDLTPPTTVMRAMAAETFGNQTVVRWTAADRAGASAGAGVHSVTVFASRNGGAFLPVGTSRADSLVFSGEIGSTYQFYAMATDAVGNAEEVRPGAVATTLRQPTASEGDLMAGMFELGRTYPNPVRGQATVRFSVASGERVRLEVFDLLGKRVAVLLDGERTAGVHEVAWDAGTLASGVYLLRLQQGRNTQVQQAVVVR
ncbi:MAG TPA: T9SS type A sorting domain-containing protein, partial [Rhodothermales bacterium]|nr:T9SS type A sorting domain-containing protein [Rhodothermales bacterium]